jgi:hypothetical protein
MNCHSTCPTTGGSGGCGGNVGAKNLVMKRERVKLVIVLIRREWLRDAGMKNLVTKEMSLKTCNWFIQ